MVTGASASPGQVITCGFCGADFVEDPGQAACRTCPLATACGLARCPRCHYENPKRPGWLLKLRRWTR